MRFVLIFFLLLLTGCATGGGDEIVPIRQLLAETAGRPYECVNHDPVTDSCRSQALVTKRGNELVFDIRSRSHFRPAGIADGGELQVRIVSRIEGNSMCSDLSRAEVRVSGVAASDASRIAAAHRANLRQIGSTCTTYLRHAGHYRFVNVTPSGFVVTDGIDRARFFERPRALR